MRNSTGSRSRERRAHRASTRRRAWRSLSAISGIILRDMERLAPTLEEALAGLRLCATVARSDGILSPKESALLSAAGRALGAPCDPTGLASVSTEEIASALPDPAMRERAIQAA